MVADFNEENAVKQRRETLEFFRGKRVFITGHTGFKGAWLTKLLLDAGAIVVGYALEAPTDPSLYKLLGYDRYECEPDQITDSEYDRTAEQSHMDDSESDKADDDESNQADDDESDQVADGESGRLYSVIGDIRDYSRLVSTFVAAQPEIVIHMAAQPLVRESYRNPRYTYEVNVMGTVNICECIRLYTETKKLMPETLTQNIGVRSFLNVTTDKVYKQKKDLVLDETGNLKDLKLAYVETDELDGYDPYSNSKSCSELVTHSYINSYFIDMGIPVSTARAGNVIGGGDFAADRIIPDCVRAGIKSYEWSGDVAEQYAIRTNEREEILSGIRDAMSGSEGMVPDGMADDMCEDIKDSTIRKIMDESGEKPKIIVRNPFSIRPYQHVLEPLMLYLTIVKEQYENPEKAGFYNIGPDEEDCIYTADLVHMFCKRWRYGLKWESHADGGLHEALFLRLDNSLVKKTFGWKPVWNIERAVAETVKWSRQYLLARMVEQLPSSYLVRTNLEAGSKPGESEQEREDRNKEVQERYSEEARNIIDSEMSREIADFVDGDRQ